MPDPSPEELVAELRSRAFQLRHFPVSLMDRYDADLFQRAADLLERLAKEAQSDA